MLHVQRPGMSSFFFFFFFFFVVVCKLPDRVHCVCWRVWLQAELLLGLLIFSGFVVFDTQVIIAKHEFGDSDYLSHALDLFVDAAALFRRILVLLASNKVCATIAYCSRQTASNHFLTLVNSHLIVFVTMCVCVRLCLSVFLFFLAFFFFHAAPTAVTPGGEQEHEAPLNALVVFVARAPFASGG